MKTLLCAVVALGLAVAGLAQTVTITGVNIVGGGSPSSWCSSSTTGSGVIPECTATLDGYSLNTLMIMSAGSTTGESSASANIAGSMTWNVEWTGATAPSPDAAVVLSFTTNLMLITDVSGSGYSNANETGDEIVGSREATNGGEYSTRGWVDGNVVYTSVGTWTEVSSGVWTGTTGYYTANLVGDAVAGVAIPNDGSASAAVHWMHSVSVYSVVGVVVS